MLILRRGTIPVTELTPPPELELGAPSPPNGARPPGYAAAPG